MKKSKIFIVAGTVILVVAAFLSSKANREFTALTAAYTKVGTINIVAIALSPIFTTVKGTFNTVLLYSGTIKIATFFSSPALLQRVYLKTS